MSGIMPTLKFDGFEFTGTAAECIAMAAEMRAKPGKVEATTPTPTHSADPAATPSPRSTPPLGATWPMPFARSMVAPLRAKRQAAPEGQTLLFLKAILDHTQSGGLTGEELMPILGLNHPKGVGSRTSVLNKSIESLGYKAEEVYTKHRDNGGQRRWKAGPKMHEAIETISKLAKKEVG